MKLTRDQWDAWPPSERLGGAAEHPARVMHPDARTGEAVISPVEFTDDVDVAECEHPTLIFRLAGRTIYGLCTTCGAVGPGRNNQINARAAFLSLHPAFPGGCWMCGAPLELDPDTGRYVCPECGEPQEETP